MNANQYPTLLAPLKIGSITLKNRILSAPTSLPELDEYGRITPNAIAYYAQRARGGAASVTVGESIVQIATGKSHPRQIPLDDDGNIAGLTRLAESIRAGGSISSIELSHGGSLCPPAFIGGRNAFGPSAFIDEFGDTIEEMSLDLIDEIIEAFGTAAATVKRCGFDMCMIHGGHGWLIHQFLSPLTNFRTDEFGGSFENRVRFSLMVIDRVRAAVGSNFPIEFRMSGSERTAGGYGLDEGVRLAKALDGKVDLIHVSAGTQKDPYSAILMHPSIFQKHGENVNLAAEIKKHVKTPVVSVGAFSEPDKMEAILATGQADALSLGRALIADPFLPRKLLRNQADTITPCLRCHECMGSMMGTYTIRCAVNPIIGRELTEIGRPEPKEKFKVLVAGGGPGGMAAAIQAAEQGHEIVLYEARDRLGGYLKFAEGVDFKSNIIKYRDFLISRLHALNIRTVLGTAVDQRVVNDEKPDVLIAAVGGTPIVPPIPGVDGDNVFIGADIDKDTPLGKKVVIIGGGLIGCETGVHLANDGHEVTVIEMRDEPAKDCGHFHRVALIEELKKLTVKTDTICTEITETGVRTKDLDGAVQHFEADSVILAAGMRPNSNIVDALRPLVPEFYTIGDCRSVGKIINAVCDGYDIINTIS